MYFQVSTGRMPLANQGAQADRKTPRYTEQEVEQLATYVQTYGGGPAIPTGNLRDGDLAEGGELFRLNCAQCHGATGRGAPLSAGKYAPGLYDATDTQIYTAMLSGPESMPVFGDNQLTPSQKRAIVNYVQTLKAQKDPGGAGHRPDRAGVRGPGHLDRRHRRADRHHPLDRSQVVTDPHAIGLGQPPTEDELRQMTPEEAMVAGAEVDGVHIVHRRERFPIPGTKAERRVERAVASALRVGGRWPVWRSSSCSSPGPTSSTCPAPLSGSPTTPRCSVACSD